MALSIIGCGFGRTGTMSLKLAVEELSFGLSHHMDEVFKNPPQLERWQRAAAGEDVDWDTVYKGYQITVDWPGAHFWRQLSTHYPDAKVILTMRPAESWWTSYSNTIQKFFREVSRDIPEPHFHGVSAMAWKLIVDETFGGAVNDSDKDKIIAVYEKHVADVQAAFDGTSRLLCFDVRDGWEPLCDFLDKPVPDTDFPRSNSSEEFWDIVTPPS